MIRSIRLISLLLCTSFVGSYQLLAQEKSVNELTEEIKKYQSKCHSACLSDTNLIILMNKLMWQLKAYNIDSALLVSKQSLAISDKIGWLKGSAIGHLNVAICKKYMLDYKGAESELAQAEYYWNKHQDRYPKDSLLVKKGKIKIIMQLAELSSFQSSEEKALEYYSIGLKKAQQIKDVQLQAGILGNMAIQLVNSGDYERALQCNLESTKLFEQIQDEYSLVINLRNIGDIYSLQGENEKALTYLNKALLLAKKMNNQRLVVGIIFAIANAESDSKNFDKALSLYKESEQLYITLEDTFSLVELWTQMADIHFNMNNKDSLFYYANKALKAAQVSELSYQYFVAKMYLAIAHHLNGNNTKAGKLFKELNLETKNSMDKRYYSKLHELAYFFYSRASNYIEALMHYEQWIIYRDSLKNEESSKRQLNLEFKYEYEKKAAADSVMVAEEKKVTSALFKQEQTQRYALCGGLGLVALFAIFMVNRFRVANNQKKIIEVQKKIVEQQKHIVEEKQKEILDSILYAKRIQQSLLTNERYIDRNINKLK